MALKPTSRPPIGRQAVTPRRRSKAVRPPALALPIERDSAIGALATQADPKMVQAKRDLDAGQVDTDMHATPGLDAERRARLVPGPGGQPLKTEAPSLTQQKADFKAEGSPPPGKVSTSLPLTPADQGKSSPR